MGWGCRLGGVWSFGGLVCGVGLDWIGFVAAAPPHCVCWRVRVFCGGWGGVGVG